MMEIIEQRGIRNIYIDERHVGDIKLDKKLNRYRYTLYSIPFSLHHFTQIIKYTRELNAEHIKPRIIVPENITNKDSTNGNNTPRIP